MSARSSWIVVATLLASVAPAAANMGKPWSGGQRAGEPTGITDIAISHEDLVIDTRPLAEGGLVSVAATYRLDNQAGAKHLDLVFASGSATVSGFRVRLDGKPVESGLRLGAELPASWRPPDSVPLPGGGMDSYELDRDATTVGFAIDVPPGKHDLAITYAADAVTYHAGDPTVLHEFAYVLSPARTWAGFGGLDVTLHVSSGWRVAVSPPLARSGDTLHATFATVPADAIAFSVQAPTGAYTVVRTLAGVLFAIVALGGGFVVAWHTRSRDRRAAAAGKLPSRIGGIERGLVWGAAVLASGALASFGADHVLPAGQADLRGYGQGLAMAATVIGSILAIGIGALISRIASKRAT